MMLINCYNCNSQIIMNKFKGVNKTFIPCSFECFIETCKQVGKPISMIDMKVNKNKGVKVFRSQLEKEFNDYMISKGVSCYFEPYFFTMEIKSKKRYYLPDFFLPEYEVFIEIKGDIWGDGAYSKYKEFSKYIPIILINNSMFKLIKINNKSKGEFSIKGEIDVGK